METILHVELFEQTATTFQLRFWSADQNEVRERTLAPEEIHDLIELAETEYYSPLPLRLRQVGERLFRWLDGRERWLSAAIRDAENQARVLVLAIAAPHGLAHLPWEVLHDGSDFLVHALNPPVLPVRWRAAGPEERFPKNQPLQLPFMASSPVDLQPVLDFEGEEHAILTATRRWPLDLLVEESGCLEELGALVQDHGHGFFDVLHLSGHAGHGRDQTPFFSLEDGEGRHVRVTATELARTLFHRPPLVFLSGCRTGQNAGHGEVRSLAGQLVANGFRAVLGWGRRVQDGDAIRAAQHIYRHLSAGDSITVSLVRTYALLREDGVRDWHLLRLFFAGEPPAPLVTPLLTKNRPYMVGRPAESEFLDPRTRTVKVATRAGFVGRRRLLQSSLRVLREREGPAIGLLLHSQGGRGKSSVAARLCDRLRRSYQRVVVIGRLDEASLLNSWTRELLDDDVRRVLRDPSVELRLRIELTLHRLADTGNPAPLFVLDDFEQNQPLAAGGDLALAPHAHDVLRALSDALVHAGVGRVLVTCRYALPVPFDGLLVAASLPPLDGTERRKQLLRLEQKAARSPGDPALLEDALGVADGNPRLLEWLHAVLEQPGLDSAAILDALRNVEERFREHILARHLVASLPEADRVLLGRMLPLSVPVPLAAVRVLAWERDEAGLRQALGRAAGLGLMDVTDEDGEPHYRVPRQLGGGEPPPLRAPAERERAVFYRELFEVLYPAWWQGRSGVSDGRTLELIRLGAASGKRDELVVLARTISNTWLGAHRYAEADALLEPLLDPAGRHPTLLMNAGRAKHSLGQGRESGLLLKEAVARSAGLEDTLRATILFHYTGWLESQGELDEVVRISREELLPLHAGPGGERKRAVTFGRIADVLAARGEMDEALRIRREEELPVYERLGDQHAKAMALGQIADVLAARGEVDEALRLRREEELAVYERLGSERSRAVALGQICTLLVARGELDEALRIERDEILPVFERLGDARERAVTLGKISDVLAARGEVDEALRLLREQILPTFERLGDVLLRAVTLGKIADALTIRGELDEALRIRREEQLPVYEHLSNSGERAAALFNIADLLLMRGDLDEALRMVRDEVIPLLEHLGDVRSRAVALGKVSDVLAARGEFDEALRIRREEELPVYERLKDARELIISRMNLAVLLIQRGRAEDRAEAAEHLRWSYRAAARRGYKEAAQLAGIFQQLGLPLPEAAG